MGYSRWKTQILCAIVASWMMVPAATWGQAPNAPQAPVAPAQPGYRPQPAPRPPVQGAQQPRPQPGAGSQGHPVEYAFRPDLSNPEYGMCLKMEKQWKNLWHRYYQLYQQARMMNPNDSQYQQMVYYLNFVKSQLDTAWHEFSNRCVYFPRR